MTVIEHVAGERREWQPAAQQEGTFCPTFAECHGAGCSVSRLPIYKESNMKPLSESPTDLAARAEGPGDPAAEVGSKTVPRGRFALNSSRPRSSTKSHRFAARPTN